jgi:plastocyanin
MGRLGLASAAAHGTSRKDHMNNRMFAVGAAGLCLALGVSGVAVAANTAAVPKSITIKQKQSFKMVPNRYIQDGLRWDKDVYKVKSGGTVTVVNTAADEGPHTLTIVKKKDLPKTPNCAICNKLGEAHGADPNSDAPPKFQFLENGVGQDTAPDLDRPGDSGVTGQGKKGEKISFKVTAKKGSQLYFMCIIHPWMQAKLQVQ